MVPAGEKAGTLVLPNGVLDLVDLVDQVDQVDQAGLGDLLPDL